MVVRVVLLALVALGGSIESIAADGAAPASERHLRDTLAASVNNVGLQNTLELSHTRALGASRSPLRRDAHVAFGLTNFVTPSHARLGAWAELAPLSVLGVRVGVEPAAYFGTFGSLLSFRSYTDNFSKDARRARKAEAHSGTAARGYASPTLRTKVGSIVAMAGADFEWWWSSAQGPLFYEPARDTLLAKAGGRMVNASGLVLWNRSERLVPGLSYRLTDVPGAPQNRIQRAGVLVIGRLGGRESHKRLAANLFYYLSDPSKRHQAGATLALIIDDPH
jgi:hypothetical protein